MLKNILNLTGAQELSKKEQNSINGGGGENCLSQNYNGATCRCDFPTHCLRIPEGQMCPAGSTTNNLRCLYTPNNR